MPQAIATGAALVILIVACLLLSVDLFVLLVVVFMILALWELRVDFATVGLHLPVFMLWLCSSFTLIATYYSPYHLITMSLSIIVSIILIAIAASAARLLVVCLDALGHVVVDDVAHAGLIDARFQRRWWQPIT